jgi:indole-3-glycerol phosphate synthase
MNNFLAVMRTRVLKRVEQISLLLEEASSQHLNFCHIFQDKSSPAIIAEIKFASPSQGAIYPGSLTPVQLAENYCTHGARALSVLTEPYFFRGDIQYIRQIRSAFPLCPILLKDFILHPLQIKQAQVFGANAVLLIVAFLTPALLQELYTYAVSLNLTPLVEVHDAEELSLALELKPKIIGINNRNLRSLAVALQTSYQLIQLIPDTVFAVCESGISTCREIKAMITAGFDGLLIGSKLMQSPQPGEVLSALLKEYPDAL